MSNLFNQEVIPIEWTVYNYAAQAQKNLMCPAFIKSIPTDGHAPATVDYRVAINFCVAWFKDKTRADHLRTTLDNEVSVRAVKITTGGFTSLNTDTKEGVVAKVVAGYFVPEKREADVLPSWISDAVSYQHTSTAAKVAPGTTGFTVSPEAEKKLAIAQQSFTVTVPTGAFTEKPEENSTALYESYKVVDFKGKPNHNMALAHSQMAHKWAVHGERKAVGTLPDFFSKYVNTLPDGTKSLPVPNFINQPIKVCTDEKNFYTDLTAHRNVRGSDNKGVSALTAGYYIASMSRALDRTMWQTADILQYMLAVKRSIFITEYGSLTNTILANLTANNIDVYVIKSGMASSKFFTVLDPLKWHDDPKLGNAVYYVSGYFGKDTPVAAKKKLIGQSKEDFVARFAQFTEKNTMIILTHLYLRDYHAEYLTHTLPSCHVHAGHIIIGSVPLYADAAPFNIKTLFARATMANKYKTAFPVRRTQFWLQDKLRHPIFQTGFYLVSGSNAKSDLDGGLAKFEDDYEEVKVMEEMNYPPVVFASKQVAAVSAVVLDVVPPPLVEIPPDEEDDEGDVNYDEEDQDELEHDQDGNVIEYDDYGHQIKHEDEEDVRYEDDAY